MKTKEEIEQLAIKHANLKPNFDRAEEEYYNSGAINAYESFMHGYTQCQEDMADKKYTKAQMKACFYHNCIDNAKVIFDDYLKKYVTD
jgi:hypothetical protein